MTLTVLLFAAARDLVGTDRVTIEAPTGVTVRDMRRILAERQPALATLLARCRIAVNQEFAAEDTVVTVVDEIAVIPPVSGG